jgi:hypothetical protein
MRSETCTTQKKVLNRKKVSFFPLSNVLYAIFQNKILFNRIRIRIATYFSGTDLAKTFGFGSTKLDPRRQKETQTDLASLSIKQSTRTNQ